MKVVRFFLNILLIQMTFAIGTAYSNEIYELSLAKIPLKDNECIVGVEVMLNRGGIYSVPRLPMGWYITIDNDPSWMTSLKGNIVVGAAALNNSDRKLLDHFLIIEKFDDRVVSRVAPFDLEVKVWVIDFSSGDKERTVHVGKEIYELRKTK